MVFGGPVVFGLGVSGGSKGPAEVIDRLIAAPEELLAHDDSLFGDGHEAFGVVCFDGCKPAVTEGSAEIEAEERGCFRSGKGWTMEFVLLVGLQDLFEAFDAFFKVHGVSLSERSRKCKPAVTGKDLDAVMHVGKRDGLVLGAGWLVDFGFTDESEQEAYLFLLLFDGVLEFADIGAEVEDFVGAHLMPSAFFWASLSSNWSCLTMAWAARFLDFWAFLSRSATTWFA